MPARPRIFLSHIDEERDLARLLKEAVEREFAGFVDVFSFSDAEMNPAGEKIIKNIENYLADAAGGIFLISPFSLIRPWINFELGALWMRTIEDSSIRLMPFCHSGSTVGNLPMPIGQLNAITASDSTELRRAFISLQATAGGSGELRTDFHTLASQIQSFENRYTIGDAFKKLWSALVPSKLFPDIVRDLDEGLRGKNGICCNIGSVEQSNLNKARAIARKHFGRKVQVNATSASTGFTGGGIINTADVEVVFSNKFYQSIRSNLPVP